MKSIKCAHCGEDYLHQEIVLWFRRTEDNEKCNTAVVTIDDVECVTTSNRYNPSGRRDGMIIGFSCEHGCSWTALNVWQHKGNSYFSVTPFPEGLLESKYSFGGVL